MSNMSFPAEELYYLKIIGGEYGVVLDRQKCLENKDICGCWKSLADSDFVPVLMLGQKSIFCVAKSACENSQKFELQRLKDILDHIFLIFGEEPGIAPQIERLRNIRFDLWIYEIYLKGSEDTFLARNPRFMELLPLFKELLGKPPLKKIDLRAYELFVKFQKYRQRLPNIVQETSTLFFCRGNNEAMKNLILEEARQIDQDVKWDVLSSPQWWRRWGISFDPEAIIVD